MKDRLSNPGYNWRKAQEQRIAAKNRILGKESPAPAPTIRVTTEKDHRQATKAQQFLTHYGSSVKKYYGQPMPISKEVLDDYFQAALDSQMKKYAQAVKEDLQRQMFAPSKILRRLNQEYPERPFLWELDEAGAEFTCMWCATAFDTVEALEAHEEGCC